MNVSTKTIRLLVIDDHLVFREALAHALEGEAGFPGVAQADDGQAGVEAWQQYRPDVTLLDASVSGLGGIKALRGIRAIDAGGRPIVLALSRLRASGAESHLSPRELEVLTMLRDGFTHESIAAHLAITNRTVQFHVTALKTKRSAKTAALLRSPYRKLRECGPPDGNRTRFPLSSGFQAAAFIRDWSR